VEVGIFDNLDCFLLAEHTALDRADESLGVALEGDAYGTVEVVFVDADEEGMGRVPSHQRTFAERSLYSA